MKRFAAQEGFSMDAVKEETSAHLLNFLNQEIQDVSTGARPASSINCTYKELLGFVRELGIEQSRIPAGIEKLCKNP
jgi:hypothetical protein